MPIRKPESTESGGSGGFPPGNNAHTKARANRARGLLGVFPQDIILIRRLERTETGRSGGGFPQERVLIRRQSEVSPAEPGEFSPRKEGLHEGPTEASPGTQGMMAPMKVPRPLDTLCSKLLREASSRVRAAGGLIKAHTYVPRPLDTLCSKLLLLVLFDKVATPALNRGICANFFRRCI
jgi:hypothetical protein